MAGETKIPRLPYCVYSGYPRDFLHRLIDYRRREFHVVKRIDRGLSIFEHPFQEIGHCLRLGWVLHFQRNYLGKIRMWSDPEIADANPNVSLPDEKIIVVHRSDDCDTTYLWTEFLSRVSPEWKAGPGTGLRVRWPVGFGAKGDDGVEDLVIGPTGDYGTNDLVSCISKSIGYVQLHYAIENRLPYGDVQSDTSGFVRAAESSVMAAAASAIPDNYEPGERRYGIDPLSRFALNRAAEDSR